MRRSYLDDRKKNERKGNVLSVATMIYGETIDVKRHGLAN